MIQRIKFSDHFYLDELVPKEIYMTFYEKSIMFLDPRTKDIIEGVRNYFGVPLIINNWWTGGNRHNSGFVLPEDNTESKYSQHLFGRGYNLWFPPKTNYEKIRETIRERYDSFKKMEITTIESDTPDHLHIDCRQTNLDTLYEVNSK
jgi:hypothetical protein